MNAIYVFETGEYSRRSIEMVSTDVKLIAKLYAETTNSKSYNSSFDSPNVEIWVNNNCVGYFHEFEKNESKIIKALSKKASGIN